MLFSISTFLLPSQKEIKNDNYFEAIALGRSPIGTLKRNALQRQETSSQRKKKKKKKYAHENLSPEEMRKKILWRCVLRPSPKQVKYNQKPAKTRRAPQEKNDVCSQLTTCFLECLKKFVTNEKIAQ